MKRKRDPRPAEAGRGLIYQVGVARCLLREIEFTGRQGILGELIIIGTEFLYNKHPLEANQLQGGAFIEMPCYKFPLNHHPEVKQ